MDAEFYERKIKDMLHDTTMYEETDHNKDRKTISLIRQLILNTESTLTDKEQDYLTKFECKTSTFYGLPKIHKSVTIIKAIQEQNTEYVHIDEVEDLKFRPIIAGPACPTHRLSNLIDILLKPFIKHIGSYVRDDIDFLNHLPKHIGKCEKFVTFDNVSLYNNIPHDLGIEALTFWLNRYPADLDQRYTKDFIIESAKLILHNNHFEFGNSNFKQVLGTAMGTKFAPTYASLVLGFLEITMYQRISNKYDKSHAEVINKEFKRYLDDCFLVWNDTWGDVFEFHDLLNNLHPSIKFTMEQNYDGLAFLDIFVKRKGSSIITDIYYKPTDTKQYLDYNSCHPRHIRRNVPFNLARRICTIVEDELLRHKRLEELKVCLIKRHYPLAVIEYGIEKAKDIDITILRTPHEHIDTDIITFVTTHNPNNVNMFNFLQINKEILNNSTRCKDVFRNTTFVNSKRQNQTLKSILVRASFQNSELHKPAISKCGKSRCGCCNNILEKSSLYFKNAEKLFQIKTDMDCSSQNLIYALICGNCKKTYIGETGDILRNRVRVHRQQIDNPNLMNLKVSHHISQCSKHVQKNDQFQIIPIYKIKKDDTNLRRQMETYFINMLMPDLNH